MTILHALVDRVATWIRGGMRVRVVVRDGHARATLIGRIPPLTPSRAIEAVLECKPPASGVIDLFRDARGLRIRARGALCGPFEQRVRNVIGNL